MKAKYLYLVFAVVGVALPYSQYIPYVMEHGFRFADLWEKLFVNPIANFFAYDLLLTAILVIIFMLVEARRIKLKHVWLPIVLVWCVGIAVGLPVFLYQRAGQLDQNGKHPILP